MLQVTDTIMLDDREVEERFVRAWGSAGQHLTKTATAVELRLNISASSLPDDVKARLTTLGGRAVTSEGVLVVVSRLGRSQRQNRETARARLLVLLRRAATPPKIRKGTHPRAAVRARRLTAKRSRGGVKRSRGGTGED